MSKVRGPLSLDVDDVVDARVRVGLDAELVGPEGVDDVERGDVEPDQRVGGQHEVRRLDAAVARVAVRELPLLADHLHVHRLASARPAGTRPSGPGRRRRRSGAARRCRSAASESTVDGRDDRPRRSGSGCHRGSGGPSRPRPPRRGSGEREADEEQDEEQDGRDHRDEHVLSSTCPDAWTLPFPGGICGPEEDRDDRREDRRSTTSQRIRKRRP